MHHTRKNVPWKGWKYEKPGFHEKTVMKRKCGKKCFLGPGKTFPICKKKTCKISRKGLYAAYIRAREYQTIKHQPKYAHIASKALRLL